MRIAYLTTLGRVWPVDGAVAVVAGEIMALLPDPPTRPRRSHHLAESRHERLARWRFARSPRYWPRTSQFGGGAIGLKRAVVFLAV
jgi:hypothetical protein